MGWMISDNVITGAALFVVLAALAVWAALVLWSWHDMAGRSRNTSLRFLAAVLVAVLNVPGLLVYLMLRPRETLADAYERSLEEEVLLRGIEEKSACPSCKVHTQPEWQLCPACHTRLRKPCIRCGSVLHLDWERCPLCTARQAGTENDEWSLSPRRFRSGVSPQQGESLPAREGDEQTV